MTTPSGACPHAHDDAAYVLGALSPTERLAFERHLPTCEACSTSVRSLAGMPGLLDLADARVLADPVPDPPLPPALLASLTRTVVARRRRRAAVVAALAGAAAAALALAVPAALDLADRPPSGAVGSDARTTTPPTESRTMVAQGDVPLTAELGLEPVTWGTRMVLTCTYDKDAIGIDLPEEVDYLLFVTDERGRTEQVGSWTSVSGTTMTVPAATAVRRDDIADVEVRTTDGRVVLRLGA